MDLKFNTLTPAILAELRSIVGDKYVIADDPEQLEAYGKDETPGDEAGRRVPDAVVRPRTAEEIAAIMKLANRELIPVTPRGAGSGLSGGAVPVYGGIVLGTDRMNSILEFDAANLMLVAEPGVITSEINVFLEPYGLFYAGYPMSLETCFLGGNVAENAGGGKAVKYGVTSRYVLGLEVVTPTGEIIELGGKLCKDATGYNLVPLMSGSEGTLGIFTKIILKLLPQPKANIDLLCLFPDAASAIGLVPKLIAESGVTPTSIEFMDRAAVKAACDYLKESIPYENCGAMLLLSLDGSDAESVDREFLKVGEFCEKNGATEVYVANTAEVSERIWRIRRNINEACNLISSIQRAEDIVVPPGSIPLMIDAFEVVSKKYGVFIPCFGHAGDGNLHARIVADPAWSREKFKEELPKILAEIYTLVGELGGRLSGEHGIGTKLKKYMPYVVSPEYMELLKRIKFAFDPNGVLNPGKIF